MPLTGPRFGFIGKPGEVHTEPKNDLGSVAESTEEGNLYQYIKGAASNHPGAVLVINPAFQAVLANTTHRGPIAISTAGANATCYEWAQIAGTYATANVATHSSGTTALFLSAADGRATTTAANNALIDGAIAGGNSANNVGPVRLQRPFATGHGGTVA